MLYQVDPNEGDHQQLSDPSIVEDQSLPHESPILEATEQEDEVERVALRQRGAHALLGSEKWSSDTRSRSKERRRIRSFRRDSYKYEDSYRMIEEDKPLESPPRRSRRSRVSCEYSSDDDIKQYPAKHDPQAFEDAEDVVRSVNPKHISSADPGPPTSNVYDDLAHIPLRPAPYVFHRREFEEPTSPSSPWPSRASIVARSETTQPRKSTRATQVSQLLPLSISSTDCILS